MLTKPQSLRLTAVLLAAGMGGVLVAACSDASAPVGQNDDPQIRNPAGALSSNPSTGLSSNPVDQNGHVEPRLPSDAPQFYPSQVEAKKGRGHELADVARCEPCHAAAVAAWRSSPHALASFQNPLYRVSVDDFRAKTGLKESRFCGGCHDPSLLIDGAMDVEVSPNDPRAYAGVSCEVCHGITAVRPGGNAAYTLSDERIPIPNLDDPASIEEHKKKAMPKPIQTSAMCSTCHKAFLGEGTKHPHFFSGQDDALPFRRSIYAGDRLERIDDSVAEETCANCHMRKDAPELADLATHDGRLASHAFAASHSLLASMNGDGAQIDRIRDHLEGVASIDVALIRHADGRVDVPAELSQPMPGEALEADVVVRNLDVGHFFPGGTIELQDTWIEVEARDREGNLVAEAGTDHERSGNDPTAHRLRAELLDEAGQPVRDHEVERFRALGYNQAIAPRDAAVVTYAFRAPTNEAAFPLTIVARLRHRARGREMAEAACADASTPRSRAFQARSGIDACAVAPVIDVAINSRVLDGSGAGDDAFVRLTNHARASLHSVQEKLDRAAPSLERAYDIARADDSPHERAVALSLMGDLAGKQGRIDDALRLLTLAAVDAPDEPAADYLRGKALANVWRFDEAASAFERAASAAPNDDTAWSLLAIARASSNQEASALDAAMRGLALTPRHPDLLRSQALAMRSLFGDDDPRFTRAQSSQLEHRVSDDAADLRSLCVTNVPGCALERQPTHVHVMRQHDMP